MKIFGKILISNTCLAIFMTRQDSRFIDNSKDLDNLISIKNMYIFLSRNDTLNNIYIFELI
jgi:hypothetical protein